MDKQLQDVLDAAAEALTGPHGLSEARFAGLAEALNEARTASGLGWGALVEEIRRHPLHGLLQRDPYTRRGLEKPRGYAGDAVLIDMLYEVGPDPLVGLYDDPVATCVHRLCVSSPGAVSVRYRRGYIASEIDATAEASADPIHIVSVACGHLRESRLSSAIASGKAIVTAYDQDAESLAVVANECGPNVKAQLATVKELVRAAPDPQFDVAYSLGLFDYLTNLPAHLLVKAMWDSLLPGGRMIIANFTPSNSARGYMEAFMGWRLVLRDERGIQNLLDSLGTSASTHAFTDPSGNVAYGTAQKP